jgi:hypothetical protein
MSTEEYLREILLDFKKQAVDYLLRDGDFIAGVERILSMDNINEKEKAKRIRRLAYYYLRRFRLEGKEVSFIERGEKGVLAIISYLEELMMRNNCFSILDVGSGLFPTTLDSWRIKPRVYIAVDKDEDVVKKLEEFSRSLRDVVLRVVRMDVARIDDYRKFVFSLEDKPCLVIYSRILHVLSRVHGVDPLEMIYSTPSKIQVILEPKTSLVKEKDIASKEKKFLFTIAHRCVNSGICYKYDFYDFPNDVGVTLYLS